ncbi:hypothetical protein HQ531_02475, partial [bacterium]|nr:hypothetical protein [bacterium]
GVDLELKAKTTDEISNQTVALRLLTGELLFLKKVEGFEKQFLSSDYLNDVNQNLQATANLVSGIANALVDATLYGANLGEAVVNSLKQIAAQVLSMTAVWAMLTLISGGTGLIASPVGLTSFIGAGLGFNAKGTRSWRGGPTMVGEDGPELIDPPAGTRIFNNRETMNLFGGDMTETNALLGRVVRLLENQKPLVGTVNIRRKDLEIFIEQIQESKYTS